MENGRICTKCKEFKLFKEFNKSTGAKYGIREQCRVCQKESGKKYCNENKEKIKNKYIKREEKRKENGYYKKYRLENKERLTEQNKKYYIKNKEKLNKQTKENYEKNKNEILNQMKIYREENKELIKERKHKYYVNNKDKINQYKRSRPVPLKEKLIRLTRLRIRQALKGFKKSEATKKIIGCDLDFYKEYLESKFTKGMSWENYGVNGWHIDHIKPCASFDFSDEAQINKCFHYTNTEPRWATTKIAIANGENESYIGNLEKKDKII